MSDTTATELGSYCVRRGKNGKAGIFLRAYNVRLATFETGSEQLQELLENMLDLEARPRHYGAAGFTKKKKKL